MAKHGKNVLDRNLTLRKLRESGHIEILSQSDIKGVKTYLKLEEIKKEEKIKKEEAARDNREKGESTRDVDWSDSNPLAISGSSLGARGRGGKDDNESTLITDEMLNEEF